MFSTVHTLLSVQHHCRIRRHQFSVNWRILGNLKRFAFLDDLELLMLPYTYKLVVSDSGQI